MFRFGIMGAGSIAEKFCQAVGLTSEGIVAAVASKSRERAKSFAEKQGVERYYGSYEAMLDEEQPDAVYIATTNNFHFENIMLCLEKGIPVLCEKPMFLSKAEAKSAFALAGERKVFLMEGMWSRFLPCIQKAREWIQEGKIGEIHLANYTGGIHVPEDHRIFNPELGGGALYDLMVYPLEILLYLIPQPLSEVRSQIRYGAGGVDVTDSLMLQFETCQAVCQVTAHSRIPSPCGIYGSQGYIRMEQTHRASLAERYDGQFQLAERYANRVENGFEYEIQEVIRCVREGRLESGIMPWRDTLQCAEILDRVLHLKNGRFGDGSGSGLPG